jgi:hypothetical protein
MIFARVISGLGNQLFQYAVGRQVSLLNKTELLLDISFYKDQNLRSYKLANYAIQAGIAPEEEVTKFLAPYKALTLQAKLYRRYDKLLPKYKRRRFTEATWWEYEPDLYKVGNNTYVDGYWQHYKYFEHLDKQVLDELTLQVDYPTDAKQLLAEVIANQSSVALHIRRGDYISDSNANKLMGVLPLAYYEKAVTFIKSQVQSPKFYIFSDDLNWAAQHLGSTNDFHLVDIADGTQEHIELDLMSKCRHNIIANSSFSWWGAFMNRNTDKVVVAPSQWVVPNDVNARINLQFPSWVKI